MQTSHPSQGPHLPLAFWGILALTMAVRLIGVTRPLLGNFATKSVIYAMIARNWVEGRAGLVYPTLDCLVGGKRSLHMLEFSVSAHVTGGLWWLFGGSLDVWGRATGVAFTVASVALLFLFVRRRHGTTAALGAAVVLALSPVSVIYGQNFMLDASIVFFTVAVFYGLDRWLDSGRSGWLLVATVCFALLLLTKIYMMVLLLPLGVTVLRASRAAGTGPPSAQCAAGPDSSAARRPQPRRQRPNRRTYVAALCAAGLAILPTVLWSLHAWRTVAEGSPWVDHIYSSLQGNARAYRPPDPLLWTPDFCRQILDDLTGVVLTPLGFALALMGFLDRRWREHAPWLLAMVILVAALPRKFHEMNYYWMAVLPPLCVTAGLGWRIVAERVRPGRIATFGLLLVALVLSMRYAARPAFVTPEEDRAVVAAGRAVQELTADEEEVPVVTMHGATIDLLYYCDRPGWAVAPDTPELEAALEDCRRQGARYLVVAGPEAASGAVAALESHTPVLRGDGFSIYELSPHGLPSPGRASEDG